MKSMLTVNTSAAGAGGHRRHAARRGLQPPRRRTRRRSRFYRRNLQTLLAALERHFAGGTGALEHAPAAASSSCVDVPVDAAEALLEVSAREYGVLWTPMSFFYLGGGGSHAIRLSCSALQPAQIEEGVRRLAGLITDGA